MDVQRMEKWIKRFTHNPSLGYNSVCSNGKRKLYIQFLLADYDCLMEL